MAAQRHRMMSADRRAKEFAQMSDPQLAAAYEATLLAPENIHFSPYLITAIGDLGLWPRLVDALAAAQAKK